jgi:hypothetical protein
LAGGGGQRELARIGVDVKQLDGEIGEGEPGFRQRPGTAAA